MSTRKKYVLIPVDPLEPMRRIGPRKGEKEFQFLQRHVKGFIEHVPYCDVWANEEGVLLGMPLNPRASLYCKRELVGPCVAHGRAASALIKLHSYLDVEPDTN